MITSGKHLKEVNGNLFRDDHFDLNVNPHGEDKIYLETQQLDDGKRKIYKNKFDSMDDFMEKQ